MELPEGFHREVVEARESIDDVDYENSSVKNSIDTSPLIPGGSNFKSHTLIKKSSSILAYKPSIGGVLFCFIFLTIGLGAIITYTLSYLKWITINIPDSWIMLIFGGAFSFVGGFIAYLWFKPRVFNKNLGLYYKSYKADLQKTNKHSKDQIQLNKIIAIQIIGEFISDIDSSYNSFELNLALNDGSRRNVVDHGNIKSIIDDAHILSDFLNVPIWHAKS
jgi:hypothetical protein